MQGSKMSNKTIDDYKKGYERYEKLRKLNLRQFSELYSESIKSGKRFDDLVDELGGKNEQ